MGLVGEDGKISEQLFCQQDPLRGSRQFTPFATLTAGEGLAWSRSVA